MTICWADYSAGRPGGAALRAAGFTGAIRYVGTPGHTKNITAAEYGDLVAHGLQVLLVYELGTTDWQGNTSGGITNAKAALADARNCGIPDTVGIAASVDMHLTAAQISTAVAYQRGFQSVLGARTGAYGFNEFIAAVRAAGAASWFWRCGSQVSGDWATFWQRNAGQTTVTVAGISCDINDQLNPIPGGTMTEPTYQPVDPNTGSPIGDPVTTSYMISQIYQAYFYGGDSTGKESLVTKQDNAVAAAQAAEAAAKAVTSGSTVAPTKLVGTATIPVEVDLTAGPTQ